MLGAAKARHILLLVDSCFSGDLLRETEGPVVEISEPHVRYAFGRKSRHVLTSGANEPVPDDGFPGHSTFMGFLLLELEESRHPWVLIQDLHCRVRGAVAVNSGQKPQFGHLFGAGGERDGEFVLLNQACEQVPSNAAVISSKGSVPASPKPQLALAEFPMPPLKIDLTPQTKPVAAGPHLPPVPAEILELQG